MTTTNVTYWGTVLGSKEGVYMPLPSKQMSDEDKAYVMLRRQNGETNDIADTANTMLTLQNGNNERSSQITQSVDDLRRQVATRNEELIKAREQLERHEILFHEANDAYEIAVREEKEVADKLRTEYKRLKKEESKINQMRHELHHEFKEKIKKLEEQRKELEEQRKVLVADYEREQAEQEEQFLPRMKLVVKRIKQIEEEGLMGTVLAPNSDDEEY
eukprot:COSAG05_NODE_5_length_47078_cov_547.868814_31_plen_217_part_00